MTIYSQHPSRGKVQVLATYNSTGGLHASTVTSVETPKLAEPIVEALNRISACLTVPVSVWDTRYGPTGRYPSKHLAAAADRNRRHELLKGAHSLWYEYVKLVLHEALEDLDKANAAVPEPVRIAVEAEVATEVSQLQMALAEYSGESTDDVEIHRTWDFGTPTLLFNGGLYELKADTREQMDRAEQRHFDGEIDEAVDDLRLLFEAHARCSSSAAQLEEATPSIFVEPHDQSDFHGYFLSVNAPATFTGGYRGWQVSVSKWVPDSGDPDEEEGSATGEPIVTCDLLSPPTVSEIVDLLNQVGTNEERLVEWSKTPVDQALADTRFAVTGRNDHV